MPIYRKQDEQYDLENDDVVDRTQRGDLYVKFDIAFPKTLREDQRLRITKILGVQV